MSVLKIAIVEDELIIAERIRQGLLAYEYNVLEPAINYEEGLALILKEQPDVLISDINLSGEKTGIDLAIEVKKMLNIPVIFLTSFTDKETIEKAKLAKPNAYLVKPFKKEDIYTAIELAVESSPKENQVLIVKQNKTYIKLNISEIEYVKSDHVYLEIFLANNSRLVVRMSLGEILKYYPLNLCRVHKSYAVNVRNLERHNGDFIRIQSTQIPVSKSFWNKLDN